MAGELGRGCAREAAALLWQKGADAGGQARVFGGGGEGRQRKSRVRGPWLGYLRRVENLTGERQSADLTIWRPGGRGARPMSPFGFEVAQISRQSGWWVRLLAAMCRCRKRPPASWCQGARGGDTQRVSRGAHLLDQRWRQSWKSHLDLNLRAAGDFRDAEINRSSSSALGLGSFEASRLSSDHESRPHAQGRERARASREWKLCRPKFFSHFQFPDWTGTCR